MKDYTTIEILLSKNTLVVMCRSACKFTATNISSVHYSTCARSIPSLSPGSSANLAQLSQLQCYQCNKPWACLVLNACKHHTPETTQQGTLLLRIVMCPVKAGLLRMAAKRQTANNIGVNENTPQPSPHPPYPDQLENNPALRPSRKRPQDTNSPKTR